MDQRVEKEVKLKTIQSGIDQYDLNLNPHIEDEDLDARAVVATK
jgi:hypothetical protein